MVSHNQQEQRVGQANYIWHNYPNSTQLSASLADTILQSLKVIIAEKGQGVLALSGGSTPLPLLKELAIRDFDWSKIVVTLVDERWVPIGHKQSNATLLTTHFLQQVDNVPRFVPLYIESPVQAPTDQEIESLIHQYCQQTGSTPAQPAALDVVVLGMGSDGHTASFFPDADNIASLIDSANPKPLLSCHSPSSQLPRITWSVPLLSNVRQLILHIEGEQKKTVFESALTSDCAEQLPIRSMIFQNQTPLNVFYCN